jgi:hypothetical protein
LTHKLLAERPWPDWPLVVAYGLGVDSTAMLVELAQRKIRPDLILFADTSLSARWSLLGEPAGPVHS